MTSLNKKTGENRKFFSVNTNIFTKTSIVLFSVFFVFSLVGELARFGILLELGAMVGIGWVKLAGYALSSFFPAYVALIASGLAVAFSVLGRKNLGFIAALISLCFYLLGLVRALDDGVVMSVANLLGSFQKSPDFLTQTMILSLTIAFHVFPAAVIFLILGRPGSKRLWNRRGRTGSGIVVPDERV